MKRIFKLLNVFIIFLFVSHMDLSAAAKSEVKNLICEYHTNPICIDIQKPRLSWQILSSENNVLQTESFRVTNIFCLPPIREVV